MGGGLLELWYIESLSIAEGCSVVVCVMNGIKPSWDVAMLSTKWNYGEREREKSVYCETITQTWQRKNNYFCA